MGMFLVGTSAFAQFYDAPDMCPGSITKEVHQKGLAVAQKIVTTIEATHGVSCTLKRRFQWMEYTNDIFKFKCEGDGGKLRVRVVMSAEYCKPETVKLGKYKVILN